MIRHRTVSRWAFTLPELLVIITIIALLMGLSAAAIVRFGNSQKASTTRVLMERLDSQLRKQMGSVADKARRSPGDISRTMANGDTERAKVIAVKLRLKQKFPMSYAEILYGIDQPVRVLGDIQRANEIRAEYPPVPTYVKYLNDAGINTTNVKPLNLAAPAAHESAACLMMALTVGEGGIAQSELGLSGSTKDIGGLPCLVDAWGTPLTFCIWPCGNKGTTPPYASGYNPSGPRLKFNDSGDPNGLLTAKAWLLAPGAPPLLSPRQLFESTCHAVPDRTAADEPQSLRLTPIIVSSGGDKQLGCEPLTLAITNASQSYDNVYSAEVK